MTLWLQVRQKLLRLRVGPDLRRQFSRFDTTGAGVLTPKQLRQALESLGIAITSQELRHLVARLDSNSSGRISYVPDRVPLSLSGYRSPHAHLDTRAQEFNVTALV